ncbi:MAG: ATP-dependent sacrificial sulfur transferase LarE [Armatimonadota bacterium]
MDRYEDLKALVRETEGAVIGYSGGVDSTLVAKAATEALGDRAICVLVESPLVSSSEIKTAVSQAEKLGLNLVRISMDVLANPMVSRNEPDRCYHCKRAVFSRLIEVAREREVKCVFDGTNIDDVIDYRPGLRALAELGVRSPLRELGIGKKLSREISRYLGLPTWNRPSRACLASRVPYGVALSAELLRRIERAEDVLEGLGFDHCRVRHHGDTARIELVGDDIARAVVPEIRQKLVAEMKALGYVYVVLDLEGYRVGSLNEVLTKQSAG